MSGARKFAFELAGTDKSGDEERLVKLEIAIDDPGYVDISIDCKPFNKYSLNQADSDDVASLGLLLLAISCSSSDYMQLDNICDSIVHKGLATTTFMRTLCDSAIEVAEKRGMLSV